MNILNILKKTRLEHIIGEITYAYNYLKDYDTFNEKDFVKAIDSMIEYTIETMNNEYLHLWDISFKGEELIDHMITTHMIIPVEDFYTFYKKYYTEDCNFYDKVITRIDSFGEDISIFEDYI